MHDNPYEPPRHNPEATLADVGLDGAVKRKLPRAFWVTWFSVTGLSLLAASSIPLVLLMDTQVNRESASTVALVMISIWGLGFSPFILFRAKQCEKYQHRCLARHGVVIYLACFGVCFGLAYLSTGIYVALMIVLQIWSPGMSIGLSLTAALLVPVLALYLFFLHLSARRPTLQDQNKTALDATH
jgi:hypothetical protein